MSDAPLLTDLRGRDLGSADLAVPVAHVRDGGILAYPTETVYGFGARCTAEGVERVRALKGREDDKPFLVLVGSAGDVSDLAWTEDAAELSRIFWPGSLTLVLRDPRGRFPSGVRSPSGGVAVRVSSHPLVRRLLEELDEPIISTSANPPGRVAARSGADAHAAGVALGAGSELLVLEMGVLPFSRPSTIIDCSGDHALMVREGTIPLTRLRCAVPHVHDL
ncbi:MAG: L-threonylcarbamoyladenylate synthase [Gemmatimonadota bacterium]